MEGQRGQQRKEGGKRKGEQSIWHTGYHEVIDHRQTSSVNLIPNNQPCVPETSQIDQGILHVVIFTLPKLHSYWKENLNPTSCPKSPGYS
jgi:hypothetical protein